MTQSAPDRRPSGAASASQLRDLFDRGGTGDKVAFQDPAVAPLGTDDEASGHPPGPEQVRAAERHEAGRDRPVGQLDMAAQRHRNGLGRISVALTFLAVALIAALVTWLVVVD